ncbi:MAG TPA: Na+/H+ antiporter subunit E [Saprospiraceae bacterium]|nr:Na+/H+ antiporter subunit E [Saprospiraceae bacterium]HHH54640.1 Na+/H+ antiporter subunit E [Bacteroidota bacterium]
MENNYLKSLSFSTKLSRFLMHWFLLMLVWIGFTNTFNNQEVITGLVLTAIISFLSIRLFTCCDLRILTPSKVFYMLQYIIIFLIALIKSNLDVARRVLSPSLPINPGIVKFKTKLTKNFAKMVLANSITLTPGTLSIDIVDDTFYIHWIDVKTEDPEQAYKEIAEPFEKILLKIF